MSTTDKPYTPPVTEELGGDADKASVTPAPVKPTPAPVVKAAVVEPVKNVEPTLAPALDVISVSKMLNAKGTVVTDQMIARIDRHMKYLRGEEGFNDQKERDTEQVTFIETIGNSLKMDFEGYAIVTDYLLKQVRDNQSVFSDGMAFRFTVGLDKNYPTDIIRQYQSYVELLTKIAANWKVRYKLKKLIDIAYVIQPLQNKAKENITQYFNKISSV